MSTTGEGGDAYRGEITKHQMAKMIFQAWQDNSPEHRSALARTSPPGPIALRCRYLHLIDTGRTGVHVAPVARQFWDAALVAETEIDDAIRTGRFDRASELCRELIDNGGHDEITVVNGLIGMGDVHRSRNEVEQAIEHYEAATRRATTAGYRFGVLRALVPQGYLTLDHHSAVNSARLFDGAVDLATIMADRVYLANAVLGLAECAARSGDPERAIEHYLTAYSVFAEVRTLTGQAHAAQRIGALYHRTGQPVLARDWLLIAARAFEQDNDPVGTVNVLEDMGDLLLGSVPPDADGAEVQYRAAHTIAVRHNLPLAKAHATQNLARVSRARGDWPAAVARFEDAVTAYRELGDLLGTCNALTKLAEAREQLGDGRSAALRDRVAAMFAIEQYRAANRDDAAQREYRRRFASVYAGTLRAAVAAGAPESFAVVADGLAGRRLAGLAETDIPVGVTDNLMLLQHLLVSADQRWIAMTRAPGSGGMQLPTGISRQERIARMIGSVAIPGVIREPARTAVDDLLAAVYLPPADEGADLLARLPTGCHALQLVIDPVEPDMLHRLWRDDQGAVRLDSVTLSRACAELLTVLRTDNQQRAALRPCDMTGLAELLPEGLRAAMLAGAVPRLLVLPVGDLWLVPWGAVPIGPDRLLGHTSEYTVCPSLVLQRGLRARGPVRPVDTPTSLWRSALMEDLNLAALRENTGWTFDQAGSALDAKTRLSDGAHTVILLCHGRLADGPGHYLELDVDTWLMPADVLTGVPPQRLYLITCWGGGIPGQAATEPVTIATLVLARGTVEVLATVGEYGDTPVGNRFAEWVFELLGTTEIAASRAVHLATKRILDSEGIMEWSLRDWAPLIPIGTFHD